MASSQLGPHPTQGQRVEMLPTAQNGTAARQPMHTPLLEAPADSTTAELTVAPRQRANFHPRDLFLTYTHQILKTGLAKTLDDSDVDDPVESDDPRHTRPLLASAWDYRKSIGKPSLPRCFSMCWKHIFLLSAIFHIFEIGLQFVAPQMIKVLINYMSSERKSMAAGILYAFIFFLAPSMQAVASANFAMHGRRLGFRMRGASASLVYKKILRLSQTAESKYGPGKITNIISTDAFRLEMVPFYANFIWSMPLMLTIGTWLMYNDFGIAAFTPIVITCLLYPINRILTKRLMSNSREISMKRDNRIKLLTEVLHALELVKQLTWEHHIRGLVDAKRAEEMKKIADQKLLSVFNTLVWQGIPALLPMATIGVFVILGGQLEAASVFTLFALLDLVAMPMKTIPEAIQFLVQAQVGIDRIQQLLLAEEMVELPYPQHHASMSSVPMYVRSTMSHGEAISHSKATDTAVIVSNVDLRWTKVLDDNEQEVPRRRAAWIWGRSRSQREVDSRDADNESSTEPATLNVPSLEIMRGKLVLVVGPVGSGKSTLLHGLLNEVPILQGSVEVCGSVAYCAQKPWILNATVRENILFGKEYDADLFQAVVHACSLESDLKQLENGEGTLIGARGVNLSGGQKARVSLARAVYAQSSLYILDDPLAAVDPHVANHLVEECVCGLLRDTTRILVTHQLQFSSKADLVVVIQGGRTVAVRRPSEFTSAELEQFGIGGSFGNSNGEQLNSESPPLSTSCAPVQSNANETLVTVNSDGDEGLNQFPARLPLERAKSAPANILTQSCSDAPLPQPRLQRAVSAPAERHSYHAMDAQTAMHLSTILESPSEASFIQVQEQVQQQEERQTGQVSAQFWFIYARAMGSLAACALISLYMLSNGFQVLGFVWVAQWTGSSESSSMSTMMRLAIYALLSLATLALVNIRALIFRWTSLKVSTSIHDKALWAVMRSCKSWLDTTPTGRIVNRFSQDLQRVDADLQGISSLFADCLVKMLVSLGVVIIMAPILLIAFLPLSYVYIQVQRSFRQSSRELRRLSSVAKSPIFQNLDETIAGASTIRAFRTEVDFISKNEELQTRSVATDFANSGIGRWMGMHLRFIGMAFVSSLALYVVLQEHIPFVKQFGLTLSASMVGLALRYALDMTGNMEGMIQCWTVTEQCLIPLERLTTFCQLESEGELELPNDTTFASGAETGEITFRDVVMRYGDSMPTVLKGVSFVIPGGTSVGVVGRTGSGKSTLLVALFRLRALDSGAIHIDGSDIATLGLHTLRRRLAIIPQEPIGFTGSLRFNLDPFGEKSETEIWTELERVQMSEFTRSNGLEYYLTAGGENLSVGQRQLLCAARAFLQNSKILVLDEATASVDFQTDALIQDVLKAQVKKNSLTTITIAHRISTILESDNVLVMDQGLADEFGPTRQLAGDPRSKFYTFVHPSH